MFCKRYLTNFGQAGKIFCGNCNAGVTSTTMKGDLGISEMWFNEGGIAYILSFPKLEKDGFCVTTDNL